MLWTGTAHHTKSLVSFVLFKLPVAPGSFMHSVAPLVGGKAERTTVHGGTTKEKRKRWGTQTCMEAISNIPF